MRDPETVVRELVAAWQRDSHVRRQRAPHDPVADALDSCAAELQEKFAAESLSPLTPEEWGALNGGVSPQSVTSWIRSGELEAYRDERGHWRIPRHAQRVRNRVRAAA